MYRLTGIDSQSCFLLGGLNNIDLYARRNLMASLQA